MPTIKENTELLMQAAEQGNVDDVRRLIPLSDPKVNSEALQDASRYGHTECVALLIPVSDPKANESLALQWAVEEAHQTCVELLYPVSDPVVALQQLQYDYPNDYHKWGQLQQMVEAEQLNSVLHKEIGQTTEHKVQRKM